MTGNLKAVPYTVTIPAVDGACTHQRSADPTGGAMHSAPGLPVF